MADLTVTAGSVRPGSGQLKRGIAFEAITAGQVLAKKADGTIALADANGTSPLFTVVGVAVNSAGAGQPIDYIDEATDFNPGATTVAGTPYFLSATPGGICPATDLATGMKSQFIGTGAAANLLSLKIYNSNIALP